MSKFSTESELNFRSTTAERRKSSETEQAPYLAGLMWSPLKSGELQYFDRMYVGREGLRPSEQVAFSDRCMMVIDEEDPEGKLVSQRDKARMALLKVDMHDNQVTITFQAEKADQKLKKKLEKDGISLEASSITFPVQFQADENHLERKTKVHVTPNILGIDQGDEVAEWLSHILGEKVRLVFQKPEAPRARRETAPGFENVRTILRFQDSYPITALSFAVMDILNDRLQQEKENASLFEAIHFRMSLLFGGKINEHTFVGKFLKIGSVYFYVQRSKERCIMPGVDPETGVMRDNGRLGSMYQKTLKGMHDELGIPEQDRLKKVGEGDKQHDELKALLGVDLIPLNEGYITVNDTIEVLDVLPPDLVA